MVKFRAKILQSGKSATGIEVPPAIVEGLGGGKRPAVQVQLNGYTYRSTIGSMGGAFMLPVSANHREGASVVAGDEVDVELTLDTEPRVLAIPSDLQQALDADPIAKAFFDGLSFSKKQRFTIPIEQAKAVETRKRRLDKALTDLREGRS